MGTIADKLQNIIDTKDGLANVLNQNNVSVPQEFSSYPNAFNELIDNNIDILLYLDEIKLSSTVTLEQLNKFIELLPSASTYINTVSAVKCVSTSGSVNVRNAASTTTGNLIGKLKTNDISEIISTPNSNWYIIRKFRYSQDVNNLRAYSNCGYVSSNAQYVEVISTDVPLKKLDISNCTLEIQTTCNWRLAELKGWEILFGYNTDTIPNTELPNNGTGETGATQLETEFDFNRFYTENYRENTYTTLAATRDSVIRQGYWDTYFYYKGHFAFTESRLSQIRDTLSSTNVNSIELYIQRRNNEHGLPTASTINLYLSDSTGVNPDILIDSTSTLTRGQGIWITLPNNAKQGLINGTYDHFKVYKPTNDPQSYIVYELNAKLKLNIS